MCEINYDDDAPKVWSDQRIKRARKEHRCASCHTVIKAGRPYWRRFYVACDGMASTESCCDVCWRIAERFGHLHRYTPLPSCIVEVLDECIHYGDDASKRWKVDARKIRSRRQLARAATQGATQ